MKQLELIELVQQHHPTMGHTEIRKGLNRAQNDYCARTELIKETYVQNSIAGQRYYNIDEKIIINKETVSLEQEHLVECLM